MSDYRVIMVGMPETGKTSYLAALWQVLESAEVESKLRLAATPADRQYLNEIRGSWEGGEAVKRTTGAGIEQVALRLEVVGGPKIELSLPDIAGEVFQNLWRSHVLTPRVVDIVKSADGVLLFVHPEEVATYARIDEANTLLSELDVGGETPQGGAGGGVGPPESAEKANHEAVQDLKSAPAYDPKRSCTAVQLVDVLQSLWHLGAGAGARTAVVVSAWDLVKEKTTPDKWLSRTLPLLHQLLAARSPERAYRVFGVSALGGDISDPARRVELLARANASSRIVCVDGDEMSTDVTRPLLWLAGGARP